MAFTQFANNFLSNKIGVLQKDIDHYLVSLSAPFPAIIFCLSIIDLDLLGALYSGEAAPRQVRKRKGAGGKLKVDIGKNLGDTHHKGIRLMQSIFRHKLVRWHNQKQTIKL